MVCRLVYDVLFVSITGSWDGNIALLLLPNISDWLSLQVTIGDALRLFRSLPAQSLYLYR